MFLQGKKAIVTGASRGIGRAIALRLAAAGADLACVSRSLDSLQETVQAVKALGRQVHPFAVDVSDSKAVEQMVAEVEKTFENVDILVNNAGVTRDGLLMRMSSEDWDAVLNTNLKGAFNFTKPVSRIMMRQRAGKIINIASIIGLIGNAGQANYAASKAGLIGFTKSIAREFASRSINCNVVCPGFVETDMTKVLKDDLKAELLKRIPLARFGQPDDIAGVVEFLCSPAASYMTGQILTVDGGLVI